MLLMILLAFFTVSNQVDTVDRPVVKRFVHPGILHAAVDLKRIRAIVSQKKQPGFDSYSLLQGQPTASSNYSIQGPFDTIARDGSWGYTKKPFESDVNAAYHNALMWSITGDEAHARKSIEIINAYSSRLKGITGTNDNALTASLGGFILVNAAELMRHTYSGWDGSDITRTERMFRDVFVHELDFFFRRPAYTNGNWGAARKPASEGWNNPDSVAIDAYTAAHSGHWDPAQTTITMSQYMDEVAIPQVKELLTNYGDVAVLWWDTPTNMTDEYAEKLHALLKLQPNIVTNDRLKRPNYPGDYKTPEQRIPNLNELDGKDWETCMTMNETWGYKSYANNWKTVEALVRNLIDIASKGGNYLLNVGPKADGTFPKESIDILKGMGEWMKINGEAIYGSTASPFAPVSWGRITKKESEGATTLYLHLFDWPNDGKLVLHNLKNKITRISLQGSSVKIKAKQDKGSVEIKLPEWAPNTIASVIKLEVKGLVAADNTASKEKMKTGELD